MKRDKAERSEAAPVKNSETKSCGKAEKAVLLYLHDLVGLLCGALLILLLLFRLVVVSGPSMLNTLLDGDYILLLSNTFYSEPEVGDIVVISKEAYHDGEPIVKRVIATEGQEVDIDFTAGVVYVDGVALKEDYTLTPTNTSEGNTFPLVVEEGCVFVMGDNRNQSLDSRSPQIGQIDTREILGKAIFLIMPGTHKNTTPRDFSRIGVIG